MGTLWEAVRLATPWEAMAGTITRVFGLLALLCCFVASIGTKKEGEKEYGGKVLEGKLFGGGGFEGGRLKGRVPYWEGMGRRREENEKGKKEMAKNRSFSRNRRAQKK